MHVKKKTVLSSKQVKFEMNKNGRNKLKSLESVQICTEVPLIIILECFLIQPLEECWTLECHGSKRKARQQNHKSEIENKTKNIRLHEFQQKCEKVARKFLPQSFLSCKCVREYYEAGQS